MKGMKKGVRIALFVGIPIFVLGVSAGVAAATIIHNIDYPKAPTIDPNKTKVACIGDSITYGMGVWARHDYESYPAYLQNELGPTYQTLNYGLSGRTLCKEGDRPYTSEDFFEVSHSVQADIYIIMLGTNDAKPHNWEKSENGALYHSELKAFVSSYLALKNSPTVYLLQPPKAFPYGSSGVVGYSIDDAVIENEIHSIVAEVSQELGVECVDLYALTSPHREWFSDGVHPNAEGNKAIAKAIALALN